MATKHTFILPDGTTAKRTSANRTYTHAVMITEPAESRAFYHRRDAEGSRISARRYEALIAKMGGDDADPEAVICDCHPANRHRCHCFTVAQYREWLASALAAAAERDARADAELGGPVHYGIATWCGRLDLAEKAAASLRKRGCPTNTYTVVEVTR